jgi:signal transduction histidine kinase
VAQVMQRRLGRVDSPDSERLIRSMGQIDDAVNRMNRLVNDLLDTSRFQMGRPLDLNLAPVDLVSLLKRVVRESRHGSGRHDLRFQTELPELIGNWDEDRLDRVFSNLVSNAVKYSPEGGEVVVALSTAEDGGGRQAVVTVRDQGVGIPESEQRQIFERFFRASNVQARIQGTGIGLSSARYILEQLGGQISVQSREGEGATFEVRLPLT